MNERRFTTRSLRCFQPEGYHTQQNIAAVRDFEPANDCSGSDSDIPGTWAGGLLHINDRTLAVRVGTSGQCRFCCKSPFAPVTKNFPGFRRDFRVNMRGTSSSDDK